MLTISTIPEALAALAEQTGRAWTDSELFDLVANNGIDLHAAPPITAQTTIQKFVLGVGLVEKFRSPPGHSRLAVLFPWQVGQLWLSGETMATHTERHDEIEGEHQWFTEPVRVTREQIRIKAATLNKILNIWRKKHPAPAQTTTAPVVAASEAPELPTTRVDRGWVMKKAALIEKLERQWSTINRDFQDASENGLSNAAKAPGHGNWFETDALNWARQRGKLSEATEQQAKTPATLFGGLTHRIKG